MDSIIGRYQFMRTDPRNLNGCTVDFLIIGGGIHGAAFAREASLRGCSVVLVEREDFACGTSSRSSRLIHGGVRYLEKGHLSLVREALHERERLLRLAPHLVRPLPMLMPFFEKGGKSPLLLKAGLWIYRWLSGRSTLPAPRSYGVDDCVRLFPRIRTEGLKGGALFFDARTEDLRLVLANLEDAAALGARLVNWLDLTGCVDGRYRLRDRLRDEEIEIVARHAINAAGPSVDPVRRCLDVDGDDLVRTSRGSHLVFGPMDSETALSTFLPDGRIQFVIPHPGGTICGTTDVDEAPDDGGVPESDARYLLDSLGFCLADPPRREDVEFAYTGWRSLPNKRGPAGALNREAFIVSESCAGGQVHSIVGGKLTTHRSLAERIINDLIGCADPSPSRSRPLPGGDGSHEVSDPLWWRHGSATPSIRALSSSDPSWLEPICPHRDLLRVEAVHSLRAQGAVTFTDLMLRRLFHSQGPCMEDSCLRPLYDLYLAERQFELPESFDRSCTELRAAVAALRGVLRSAD